MFAKQPKPTEPTTTEPPEPAIEDPEPTKIGPDLFIRAEWTAWEWRQAEKRLHPEGQAEASAKAQLEQRLDGLIVDVQDIVDGAARRKLAAAERLAQAHAGGGDKLAVGGVTSRRVKSVPGVRQLEEELAQTTALVGRAKALEEDLRGQRVALATRRRTSFQMVDHLPPGLSS